MRTIEVKKEDQVLVIVLANVVAVMLPPPAQRGRGGIGTIYFANDRTFAVSAEDAVRVKQAIEEQN